MNCPTHTFANVLSSRFSHRHCSRRWKEIFKYIAHLSESFNTVVDSLLTVVKPSWSRFSSVLVIYNIFQQRLYVKQYILNVR